MKRAFVGTLVGFSAVLLDPAALAQPSIYFDSYSGPVSYAASNVPLGKEGQLVETTFMAAVFIGAGTGYTSLDQLTFLPGSTMPFWTPGYFEGGPFPVPLPGAGSTFTLAVVAWETSGPYGEAFYDFNPTQPVIQGHSPLWIEDLPQIGLPAPPPPAPPRPLAFTVEIVPEPAVIGLGGLSAAMLLIQRRRFWR